jgi:hypothetical protein
MRARSRSVIIRGKIPGCKLVLNGSKFVIFLVHLLWWQIEASRLLKWCKDGKYSYRLTRSPPVDADWSRSCGLHFVQRVFGLEAVLSATGVHKLHGDYLLPAGERP